MTLLEAIILGLVQGLTEFLPVSSSGHLVLTQALFGLDEPGVTLEVMLHVGTLFSVFWVFRRDFIELFNFHRDRRQRYFILMLILGVIPTGLIGFFFSGYTDALFSSTLLVGFMLLITGTILKLLTIIPAGLKSVEKMNYKDALWIGILQGMAVIPGISRSGSTIAAALWRGLDRETAVRYSFMLSAPVIFGASLFEFREMLQVGVESEMIINYLVGGVFSFFAGVLAIRTFIKLLREQKFYLFAFYCWGVGTLVIAISLLSG